MTASRVVILFALLGVLGALVPPASATTLIPVDLGGLADQSHAVFVGTAVHKEVVASKDGSFPFTFVTFDVERTFKGQIRGRHLTLRPPRSSVGSRVSIASPPIPAPGRRC